MKDIIRDICIWGLKKIYTSIVLIGSTDVHSKRSRKHHSRSVDCISQAYIEGDVDVIRASIASLFENNPDFVKDVILPILESYGKVDWDEVPVVMRKKKTKTIN